MLLKSKRAKDNGGIDFVVYKTDSSLNVTTLALHFIVYSSLHKMVVLTNFPPPNEGIRHEEKNTGAFIGKKTHGTGTLFITER